MRALETAETEMAPLLTSSRIVHALSSKLRPAARIQVSPGDAGRVYRDRLVQWDGSYTVTRISVRHYWVEDENKRVR